MKRKKIILTTVLLFVLLAAGAAFFAFREYHRKNNTLTNTKPDYIESSIKLIDEFTMNEQQSNAKYAGKVIQVNGIVKSVDEDDKGLFTVVLGEIEALSSVRCSIDSTAVSEVLKLKPGVSTIIKGICTGFNADEMGLGADVILNRCVFVKQ